MAMEYTIVALVLCILWTWRTSVGRKKCPPGPLKLPILGNALTIPTDNPWFKFSEWKAQYGDLIYLEALGQKIVVLNSEEVTRDLLEKQGRVTSGRPVFTMLGELMGLNKTVPLRDPDAIWKYQRMLFHNSLSSESTKDYLSLQESVISVFLQNAVSGNVNIMDELRLAMGRIIMSVTYGLPTSHPDMHTYITASEETMKMAAESIAPGAHLVDLLPALKHLPSWIPLNSIPKFAERGAEQVRRTVIPPFEHVKAAMSQGTAPLSFSRKWLEEARMTSGMDELAENEENVMWMAGTMFSAGSETTYASVVWFVLAMALYPDIQRKLQKEVDSVLRPGQIFPSLKDRQKLSYLNATIKEVLRWRPPLPMAIAHKFTADDEYRGKELSRDHRSGIPSDEFAPERFLGTSSSQPLDPYTYAFGFGRRICPGKYFADSSLYLFIAGMASSTTIRRPLDADGKPLPLDPQYKKGALVSCPEDFSVVFSPRRICSDTTRDHL